MFLYDYDSVVIAVVVRSSEFLTKITCLLLKIAFLLLSKVFL